MFNLSLSERELFHLQSAVLAYVESLMGGKDESMEDTYDDLMMAQHLARRLKGLQSDPPTS